MLKLDSSKRSYPILTGVIGLVSYLLVALLVGIFSLVFDLDIFFLGMLLIGILGPLIMFLMLGIRENLVLKLLIGFFGILFGFMVGFGLGYVVAEIVPGGETSPIPNIVGLIIMNMLYALIMANPTGGKGAVGLYLLISGIIGVVLGIVFMFFQNIVIEGMDLNFLFLFATFGLTLGTCIGAYRYRNKS